MILIDLKDAFDIIDHQILLKKMKYLGFSKNALYGLISISVNKNLRQISILVTPTKQNLWLLFYVNDLPQDVVTESLLCANDPCIVLHLKNVTENENNY